MGNEEGKEEINGPQGRWDKYNRPIGYIIGATPGFAMFRSGSQQQMAAAGIARKIMEGAKLGFDFVQVDFETIAEGYEHELGIQVRRAVESQGPNFGFGIHAPVTGQIAVDLGVAYAREWEMHHRTIQRVALAAKITGAKYILFHTSHKPRPAMTYYMGDREWEMPLYSFTGKNLAEWMNEVDRGEFYDPTLKKKIKIPGFSMKDWFMARFIHVLYRVVGTVGEPSVLVYMATGETATGKIIDPYKEDVSFSGAIKKIVELRKNIFINAWPTVKKFAIEKIEKELEEITKELIEVSKRYEELKKKIEERKITPEEMKELGRLEHRIDYLRRERDTLGSILTRVERLDAERYKAKYGEKWKDELYDEIREAINLHSYIFNIFQRILNSKDGESLGPDPETSPYEKLSPIYKNFILSTTVLSAYRHYDFYKMYDYWKEKGSEAGESVAYHVVAKYMYKIEDPLWIEIVEKEAGGGERIRVDPDIAIDLANRGIEEYTWEDKKAKIPVSNIVELIVTAVACKYIQGHLLVKSDQWKMNTVPEIQEHLSKEGVWNGITKEELDKSIYEFCKENKVHIFLETEQPAEGLEGRLRIMHAKHHIILAKSIEKGEHVSYTIDFEHLTTNLIDPIEDAKNIPDGDGKFVRMVHINAPRPYGGLHGQIKFFSLDMLILYKWLWVLRQKGMKNAYLIWEWGRAGPPEESANALRRMVAMLEKDVPPDELPPYFYGLGPEFEAMQMEAIRNHALDPLEGNISFPEPSFSFFGERAKSLGKLTQWLKRKLS